MPYIKQGKRQNYDALINELSYMLKVYGDNTCGDVTYVLYKLVAQVFEDYPCYQRIAEVRAALIGTLSEFDRRYAFPYEDQKIKENGDVEIELTPKDTEEDCDGDCRGCA